MEQNFYALSPSQAFSRIEELTKKQEYEGLSADELDELSELKDAFEDSLNQFDLDF
jgi:uncharacterized protein YnzC (UPF0291/DUF896 family)